MKGYTYGWKLKEEGWNEVPVKEEEKAKKLDYVTSKLAPAVSATRQWDTCEYKLMHHDCGYEREFVVLSCNGGGGRWINVTGNSLGAILEAVAENLF